LASPCDVKSIPLRTCSTKRNVVIVADMGPWTHVTHVSSLSLRAYLNNIYDKGMHVAAKWTSKYYNDTHIYFV